MRIWDIPPEKLCRQHLLGEHRELHAIWSILTEEKRGYANHPETRRWRGRLKALFIRHDALVAEMTRRGFQHHSPLSETLATGEGVQDQYVDSCEQQIRILRDKGCGCSL